MTRNHLRLPARCLYLVLALLSGAYCLMAYLPFTYQGVIKFNMVSWMPAFVRLHPLLFLGAWGLNAWLDRGWRREHRGRFAFHLAHGLLALGFLLHPLLAGIQNTRASYFWSLTFLVSALWLVAIDLWDSLRVRTWSLGRGDEAHRLGSAALLGGLGSAAFFFLRGPAEEGRAILLGWTLSAHLFVFQVLALLVFGLTALGRLSRRAWAETALLLLLGWGMTLGFFHTVVFAALGFPGVGALVMAALIAALLAGFLLLAALSADKVQGGVDLLLSPLRPLFGRGPWIGAGCLLALLWLLHGVLKQAVRFDWNFLFQKGLVALCWLLAFAGLLALVPGRKARALWTWSLLLGPLLTMNLFFAFSEASMVPRKQQIQAGPLLEQQVGRDVAVRFLRELLMPPLQGVRASLYPLLQKNSNIPHDVRTDPVEVQHVAELIRTEGEKPDIYLFVVDSLRRDYLGAYNPEVRFTPNLDRFAAESVVMRNAFTRYGATGLSEPSIWVGGMMLHKQYIQPFHPMNSLQKLLTADGYELLVSMDSIMDVVVKPGPNVHSLEPGVSTQDLRLPASLSRLSAALDGRRGDPRPLFAFAQTQDIHISVINREGQSVVEPGNYGRFYGPYASRIQRLDAAFGAFIAKLKREGRYERSLIIFTADHGDSLGEEGRWGHAYTLFPEIIRIPMLIHLPEAWRKGLDAEVEAPAFLTDLTPSLYHLLGHRPVKVHPMLGRPLFTATPGERRAYRQDHFLLASSYGAVYGILDGAGRDLYVADGVNFEDHAFRLEGEGGGIRRPVTAETKERYDRLIAEGISAVNGFYGFKGGN